MLLVAQELCIFFGFSSSPSLACSAPFSASAFLYSSSFSILMVNLGHDFSDLRIGICLDEVPEQVGKTEKVTKSSNCVIFLFEETNKVKRLIWSAISNGIAL